MSFAKPVLLSVVAALTLSACGTINVKPSASSSGAARSRGQIDDPRTTKSNHVQCLRAGNLSVQEIGSTDLLVAGSVRVHFEATAGAAQARQIDGSSQGAEVVGSALVYPGQAPDAELTKIEQCLAQGVKG
jgi:hypothetical protein